MSQSLNVTPNFEGLILTKGEDSVLIPLGSRLVIHSNQAKIRGNLDSLNAQELYIWTRIINTENIESIKFNSAERKRKGRRRFLLGTATAAGSLVAVALWNNQGFEGFDFVALGLFLYSPFPLVKGLIQSTVKQRFVMNEGWTISTY